MQRVSVMESENSVQFDSRWFTIDSPYDNRWSKTMVGYGPESTHFVLELTYNYGVKSYELGSIDVTY